jgi:hypothetical protein
MCHGMKTPEQLLESVSQTIASIHRYPTMYVGSKSSPGYANALDTVMWMAHWFWATIQSRESDFCNARNRIRKQHGFSCETFSDGYRRLHPAAEESAAFAYALKCWAEVDQLLMIDISKAAARPEL